MANVRIFDTLLNYYGAWKGRNGGAFVELIGNAVDEDAGVVIVEQGRFDYETVAAGQTDQVLGATGAVGDYLDALIVQVNISGVNGTASIKDGAGSAIPIVPASTPIGVYAIPLHIVSVSGAWSVTTGSAATALGIGRFTA